jgi:Cdc6-like AAA superfamily ATPase
MDDNSKQCAALEPDRVVVAVSSETGCMRTVDEGKLRDHIHGIMRRAVEIAESRGSSEVDGRDVERAIFMMATEKI